MSKSRKARIWITVAALICILAMLAMSAWGVNGEYSDGLLLAMRLTGGAGVLLLLVNAVFAVREAARDKSRKK